MENTLSYSQVNRNHINPLPILLLLAGVVLAVTVAQPLINNILFEIEISQHAVDRHGEAALSVYQACDEQGPAEYFHRGTRVYSVCWVESKARWGVVVEEIINGKKQPITAILKEKLSKLGDVERWLTNTGCEPGGLP